MRPQDRIGDEVYRSGTLEAQVLDSMLRGKPLVTTGQRDAEYLDFVAGKIVRQLTDHAFVRPRFSEHVARVDGMVQQFRRPDVVLLDGAPDMPRDACRMFYRGEPVQNWLVQIIEHDEEPIYISVHPDRWEEIRDLLQSHGVTVINGDAEFTPMLANWQGEREPGGMPA